MEERNINTLYKAIKALPVYAPKPNLWRAIEMELDQEQALQEGIAQLPVYNPPEKVWQQIDRQLLEKEQLREPLRRVWPLRLWTAAASIVLLLCFALWWQTGGQNKRYTFSEELVDFPLPMSDWENDEEAFTLVDQICKDGLVICNQPEFVDLHKELEELTSARNELKDALGLYNTDKELIVQLTQIELERTELLKKLMELI